MRFKQQEDSGFNSGLYFFEQRKRAELVIFSSMLFYIAIVDLH